MHHLCCKDFDREVVLWLLVLKRLKNAEEGEDASPAHRFPTELGHEVIRQLSLLHHPIVTVDEKTGELQGVGAVVARYQNYLNLGPISHEDATFLT